MQNVQSTLLAGISAKASRHQEVLIPSLETIRPERGADFHIGAKHAIVDL